MNHPRHNQLDYLNRNVDSQRLQALMKDQGDNVFALGHHPLHGYFLMQKINSAFHHHLVEFNNDRFVVVDAQSWATRPLSEVVSEDKLLRFPAEPEVALYHNFRTTATSTTDEHAKLQDGKEAEEERRRQEEQSKKDEEVRRQQEEQCKADAARRQQEELFKKDEEAAQLLNNKPPRTINQAEKAFTETLALLRAKVNDLDQRREMARGEERTALENAYQAAYDLHEKIQGHAEKFFKKQDVGAYATFKRDCQNEIDKARPTLEKHRGDKQIADILLYVFFVGIILAAINWCITGKFTHNLFKTDSAQIVDDIEKKVNKACP